MTDVEQRQQELRFAWESDLTKEGVAPYSRVEEMVERLLQTGCEKGVVLKVDGEFPDSWLSNKQIERRTRKMPDYGGGDGDANIAQTQRTYTEGRIRRAGFTHVAPLIQESKG